MFLQHTLTAYQKCKSPTFRRLGRPALLANKICKITTQQREVDEWRNGNNEVVRETSVKPAFGLRDVATFVILLLST